MKDRFGIDWRGTQGSFFWRGPELGRRMFFRNMASAVGGYFLLPAGPGAAPAKAATPLLNKAKNAIFILLSGGPSHTDLWDLKEGPWLPTNFNPTSYGNVRVAQGLLPNIAQNMDSVAFVRSVRSWALVHSLGRVWAQILRNPANTTSKIAPHMGSVAAMELGPSSAIRTLPAFLALNTGTDEPANGYFPPLNAPFYVSPNGGGLPNSTHPNGQAAFDRRFNMLLKMDQQERLIGELGPASKENVQFSLGAKQLMYNADVTAAFTLSTAERARYGTTNFGNSCLVARNLVKAQLGTRFIQITVGGWDNHSNIYTALNAGNAASLGRQFDTALGTLLTDLKNDGTLNDTLVVAMGEFGRTTGALNSGAGRDHFLQEGVLFAGAGIPGPKAIGATDVLGRNTADPGWSENRDIRPEDIGATIYSALGIDPDTVRHDDPLGRGFEYIPNSTSAIKYKPITEIWS